MKSKLSIKIFLAFLTLTITSVVMMVLAILYFSQRNFEQYVQSKEIEKLGYLVETMADFYSQNKGWQLLAENPAMWNSVLESGWSNVVVMEVPQDLNSPVEPNSPMDQPREEPGIPPPIWDPMNLGLRITLFNDQKQKILGLGDTLSKESSALPIKVEGKTVGWLGLGSAPEVLQSLDKEFIQHESRIFYIIGGIIFLLASVIALVFSKHILTPIRQLAEATEKVTQRNFATRIPVKSSDELGNLAEKFNEMAQKLENFEQNQRRWLSDISHELRTPLSVLIGEIEALQDGIRKPDKESLESLYYEANYLGNIVKDLHDISITEAGMSISMKMESFKPLPILSQAIHIFQNRFEGCGMSIVVDLEPTAADLKVMGDPGRIMQLFTNLFANVLSHAEKPGKLTIRGIHMENYLDIIFEDSGPGVPEADISRIFERFYRTDPSRSRTTGGSGLGLTICKKIIEYHKGEIKAQNVNGGGLRIDILLPLDSNLG